MTQKRIKLAMLIIALITNVNSHAYDFEVDGIAYNITSSSNLTVEVTYKGFSKSVYNGNSYYYLNQYAGDISIPKDVSFGGESYTVTAIGENAFGSYVGGGTTIYGNPTQTNIKSVTIPSTVTSIGRNALGGCVGITAIVLPSSLKEIGESAFRCTGLNSIVLPNSLLTIGSYAFSGCSELNSVTLSSSLKQIGGYVFQNCSFTKLIIPPTISSIGESAFPESLRALIMLPYNPPAGGPVIMSSNTELLVPSKNRYLGWWWNPNKIIEMLTPSDREFEYCGQVPVVEWTNNLSGYSMTVSNSSLEKDAGSHSSNVQADFYRDDELEFTVNFPYEYTINKAQLNTKVGNASREYGEDNPSFNATYSGFVNGEDESAITLVPTFSSTATKTSNVGEYPITATDGEATNYEFVYEPGVLTVTKAPLSGRVNDAKKTYGSSNPTFSIEYFGLKNNETVPAWTTSPSFQTSATKSSGVGQYEVNAINAVPKNYDLGEITPGTLFVTPASLTIKANNATKQYYNENPTFSYTCSGFVNGEGNSVLSPEPTLSTSANQNSDVGIYEINVEGAEAPNYSISYVDGSLTVTPRTLYASVGNYERPYNEDNPTFEVNYSGFVGNDDENTLSEKTTATTTATKTSNVGTYQIKVSGGSAENYQFSYTNGTLTINKVEQTISWDQDLSGLQVGDQVELQAVASSGLPITYTMENNNAAEVYSAGNKTYLDCLGEGQFLIRAVQNGNNNYYSSPRASKTATIVGSSSPNDPTLTIAQADNGTVSMQVTKGKTFTFSIAANDGWKIHSVMFNNSDVTNKLSSDNKYTTPAITGDSWLSVVYEKVDEDAIPSFAESNVKIQGTQTGARVIDAEMGDMIRVYTTNGKLQHSVEVDNLVVDIPLAKDDIYIIQVGTKTVKLSH